MEILGNNNQMRKNGLLTIIGAAGLINLAASLYGQSIIIDFNAIPDGTALSANNPYGGILNIQAEGIQYYEDPSGTGPGISYYSISSEAPIVGGSLAVVPIQNIGADHYQSTMIATFNQPVTDVSFDAWCYRNAVFSYSGVDGNQLPFSSSGIIPGEIDGGAIGWATFYLNIPQGGDLTEFSILNRDPQNLDAAFWVNNITFTVVPEPTSFALAALGACALLNFRKRKARAV
jgi:hypothetical protein